MPRYIDADALLVSAYHLPYSYNGAAWLQVINDAQTADVVPVVRCKECEHYNTTGFPALNPGTGWCDKMDRGTHDDFYCSYGAKMEDKP